MLFLVITIAVRIWFQFYVICLHIYVRFAYLGADHESSSIIIVLFVTHQIQKEKQKLLQPTDDTHFPFFSSLFLANWCSVLNTGARQHVLMLQNFSPTGGKHIAKEKRVSIWNDLLGHCIIFHSNAGSQIVAHLLQYIRIKHSIWPNIFSWKIQHL